MGQNGTHMYKHWQEQQSGYRKTDTNV